MFGSTVTGVSADIVTVATVTTAGPTEATATTARVRGALTECGYRYAPCVHEYAPRGVLPHDPALDLARAVGVLEATGQLSPRAAVVAPIMIGELALDGRVRGVRGVLAMAEAARRCSIPRVMVPAENAREALLAGVEVLPVAHLKEAVAHLSGAAPIVPASSSVAYAPPPPPDMKDVADEAGKRALLIAAAGGHNVLLSGAPGTGKTMLAMRLPGILPPLDLEAAIEATRIYSVAGLLSTPSVLRVPPFRAPHHTASVAALVGGGAGRVQPGEVTLAHHGVLFLDELPEFERRSLEALRQPLEEGVARISRSSGPLELPARFLCVAATNPCPCGRGGACPCGPETARYQARINPLREFFDLHVEVTGSTGARPASRMGSTEMRGLVVQARAKQAARGALNARLSIAQLRDVCPFEAPPSMLRVARTIADLAGADTVTVDHLSEALPLCRRTAE